MSVTRSDIVAHLIDRYRIGHFEATQYVDDFFEEMIKVLESGNSLKISNFGTFSVRDKTSRPGRNPKTGEEVEISERRVVTFKMGNGLKEKEKEKEAV